MPVRAPSRFVRLDGVSFSYLDSVPVLLHVDCDLRPGWTAVIGPNGAGKTTFLRLLAGDLSPDEGRVQVRPRSALRFWCRQTAEACTPEIAAFASSTDAAARQLHGRLELRPGEIDRWPSLSPGERRRFQVGAALWGEPDVLLLDEPTDHLDEAAQALLTGALSGFEGVGVLVSHDRALLRALATATARVHGGSVELRRAAFDDAREGWRLENEERRSERQKRVREDRRLRRRLGQARNDLRGAEAQVRTRKRAKGRKDSDARTMAARNRARSGAAKLGREVGLLRDRVARGREALEGLRFDKELGGRLELPFDPAPQASIAAYHGALRGPDGSSLAPDISVEVRRDTRVWVRGPNGAGKTTLIGALLRELRLPRERVLVLPQELAPEQVASLQRELESLPTDRKGEWLSIAGALGAAPERLLASESPSPGEARKLAIALGLSRGVAAAFLDEPTNHLDLPAIERLEEALRAYLGAVVLVTHDPSFGAACAHEEWHLDGGTLRVRSLEV